MNSSYKHAIDGVVRVYREEGFRRLFSGASTATGRAVLMTIGQLSFYDQIKIILLNTGHFEDNLITHFAASLSAVNFIPTVYQGERSNNLHNFNYTGSHSNHNDSTVRRFENTSYERKTRRI